MPFTYFEVTKMNDLLPTLGYNVDNIIGDLTYIVIFLPFSGDGAQRMDPKNADLRACTPRSKHSATE